MTCRTAVLLLNLGGPDCLEAVEPFLYNLFSDPDIIQWPGASWIQKPLARLIAFFRRKRVANLYRQIGGGSPILSVTQRQAIALEKALRQDGYSIPVYIGMRYWHPSIDEVVDRILADEIDYLVVVPLFPQYSLTTTGSSLNELCRALSKRENSLKTKTVQSFYAHPDYLAAWGECIEQSLMDSPWSVPPSEVTILFSAHSLPEKSARRNQDPYPAQILETAERIMKTYFPHNPWQLAYQSKVGPISWLSPSTEEALRHLANQGVKNLLVVPISFVSEHLETLYEIDILYSKLAKELGISYFHRVPALNTHPLFIKTLSSLVKAEIIQRKGAPLAV